ncbi:unnamed protein product, partial [Scytosiphon promiscuus]
VLLLFCFEGRCSGGDRRPQSLDGAWPRVSFVWTSTFSTGDLGSCAERLPLAKPEEHGRYGRVRVLLRDCRGKLWPQRREVRLTALLLDCDLYLMETNVPCLHLQYPEKIQARALGSQCIVGLSLQEMRSMSEKPTYRRSK